MTSLPATGSCASAAPAQRLRVLALHSFRTSGRIFQQQMQRAGLDKELADLLDIVSADLPALRSSVAHTFYHLLSLSLHSSPATDRTLRPS